MKILFRNWIENDIRTNHPDILYHHSPSENRKSIQQEGLKISKAQGAEAIFLSDTPKFHTNSDVWQVYAKGLQIEDDWTTDPGNEFEGETWWACLEDVPPERLKLLQQ